MFGVRRFIMTACLLLAGGLPLRAGLAERVIILANADDPDSGRIARYYAGKRGVPVDNIIELSMPTVETISWRDFVLSIWQPLQDELLKRGWIDALEARVFDDAGRRKLASSGHSMSYLVLCRGVPLRINHNQELLTETSGVNERNEFKTNRASVDSELSLLAFGFYNINGFVPNPLFRVKSPSQLVEKMIVKVARLDGPEYRDVISLIDGTLEAEANGLIGRSYVDVRGPHKQGEQWMDLIINRLQSLHFQPEVNRDKGTFQTDTRFDRPALYFGWYAGNVNGPFRLPDFHFAPGAIAVHIHSYSASTLRSATSGWCGPFVARGAAVTTGAVFEPYLQLMHFPHLMLDALAEGENVGDAAYYALPVLSWQNVLIGDPLYRPFSRSLNEQWLQRDKLAAAARPYVALREMQSLRDAGLEDDALTLARRELDANPSLPLGVALAEMLHEKGDEAGARAALGFAQYLTRVNSNDWSLLRTAGDLLELCGDGAAALKIYAHLVSIDGVPTGVRVDWLRHGVKLASAQGNLKQAMVWEHEATNLAAETKK